MSYQMRNSDRSRKAGRFVARVHKALQEAVVESGLKQNDIALKLGIDRSIVNRRIMGESNLTLRSIADLAWALDQDIKFDLIPQQSGRETNRSVSDTDLSAIRITGATANIKASEPRVSTTSSNSQGKFVNAR